MQSANFPPVEPGQINVITTLPEEMVLDGGGCVSWLPVRADPYVDALVAVYAAPAGALCDPRWSLEIDRLHGGALVTLVATVPTPVCDAALYTQMDAGVGGREFKKLAESESVALINVHRHSGQQLSQTEIRLSIEERAKLNAVVDERPQPLYGWQALDASEQVARRIAAVPWVRRATVGRNDPCLCGAVAADGKPIKAKRCCHA